MSDVAAADRGHLRGIRDVRLPARRVGDGHAECRRLVGHGAANAADADEAQLLAAQLHAEHVIERPAAPLAGANDALAFAERRVIARISPHVKSAHGIGQDVGRVRHGNRRARGRRHVDVVVAHGDVGHDLQLRTGGIEHLGVDGVGEQADDRVNARRAAASPRARIALLPTYRSTSQAASSFAMTEDGSFRSD
jgi:hypothetical protein